MARARYLVRRSAWKSWEDLAEVPLLLTTVVDALAALPPEELEVRRLYRPPGVLHEVTGSVFGRRFQVVGIRDGDGNWVEVWRIKAV